jgi:hypothetical protein
MATYMSDQLEGDMKRNELVKDGDISQIEADERAEEWEKASFFCVVSYYYCTRVAQ